MADAPVRSYPVFRTDDGREFVRTPDTCFEDLPNFD